MGSADPFLSMLKEQGLCVVRVPRANVGPLTLLSKQGASLVQSGRIEELVVGPPLPRIDPDRPAAHIEGNKTRALAFELGVTLLAGWIEALGGKSAGLEAALKGARSIRFRFPSVLVDTVSSAAVDDYLGSATVKTTARQLAKDLDDGNLYLVTLGAKANRFEVETGATRSGGVGVGIPEIQKVVGASVKVSGGGGSGLVIAYQGDEPVYFGFQAIRLYYTNGRYQGYKPLAAGKAAMLGERNRTRAWLSSGAPLMALAPK